MIVDRRNVLALAGTAGLPASTRLDADLDLGHKPRRGQPLRVTDYMTHAMLADVEAGTLRVDCAPAFQAALDAASGLTLSSMQSGCKLIVPGGRYLLAQPIRFAWRDNRKIIDDGDMRRVTIEGDGQANTVMFYRGDPAEAAVQIRGHRSAPGQGDGVTLRLTITGLQIVRDLASRQRGTGLSLDGLAFVRLVDMEVSSFEVNLDFVDTLRVYMESVHANGGAIGLRARGRNFSNPNVYKIIHCSFSGNGDVGVSILGGTNVSLDTCALEGNGRDSRRGRAAILVEDGPAQGGAAAIIENCYFENNFVTADVSVEWRDDAPGTIKFTSCSFQRTSAARAATHHIMLTSRSAVMMAHIDSCAFKSFGNYTPATARQAVTVDGEQVRVHWTANLFQHPQEGGGA
jgi:hypothetical protein